MKVGKFGGIAWDNGQSPLHHNSILRKLTRGRYLASALIFQRVICLYSIPRQGAILWHATEKILLGMLWTVN